ncbi:hypothetical protein JOD54_000795 [Actinokineospora baliensis]|uniref:hypothetical protein n=1 Tax=Actinokineospora baliensis TaxID=547056 RepID=UPI0019577145|nr:hypothetical protein [Actinokineospora baliensis]MBM7770591.1 hypothetical protein [Actinokineospora baliensis]
MKLAAVEGITPVNLDSPTHTAADLLALITATRGPDAHHDPGLAHSAQEAADLAHASGAGLVAAVTHPSADPALLTAVVTTTPHTPADLHTHLSQGDITDITHSRTETGYPVVIAERITTTPGCQLQAVVLNPTTRRAAIFTLHSPTGRGWWELASLLGQLITTIEFD